MNQALPLNKEERGHTFFNKNNNDLLNKALSILVAVEFSIVGSQILCHMTLMIFLTHDKPMKNIIKTANGEGIKVEGAETISFTNNLTLKNCLFVPDLSHELLSVSQLIRDIDCTVLIKFGCCIVQDAQTGQIIGRGIERGGLYYLEEEVQKGKSVLVHESEERQLWT